MKLRGLALMSLCVVTGVLFAALGGGGLAPRLAVAQVYGPGAGSGGLFSEQESKYIAEIENTMPYYQREMSKLYAIEGSPQPAFDAAKKEFMEKEQELRHALSAMKAGGSNTFYQHKPKVDAALRAYESAYQRAQQAFR